MEKSALVLLSGGQDSCTCLAWACARFDSVHTVSFDYGQRHKIELESSKKLSELAHAETHTEIPVNSIPFLGGSALVGSGDISSQHPVNHELPASFVPGRNVLFLTLAAAKAYQLGIHDLIGGMCQTDFSGYFDCRNETIQSTAETLTKAFGSPIIIHTPLMWLTKAQTVKLMQHLGKLDWYQFTHTCYEGKRPPCGVCPACKLRIRGFQEAGIQDPLLAI